MNRLITTTLVALFVSSSWATSNQETITPNSPPFALTLEQLEQWSSQSKWVDSRNVATIPLARRDTATLFGNDGNPVIQDRAAKVLYAPDGMNNFGNYLARQPKFNLYNFTHWSDIDILNWFAGTAKHTVQIPAKPWVDAAHKNGVKVIGSVFLGVAQWGGSADTVEQLLIQDAEGRFLLADKLIHIAQFYGFDGWLINQETDLTSVKDKNNNLVEGEKNAARGQKLATKMLAFVQYLTANAPSGMEIHWYDSMVASGEVKWQNELNEVNSRYLSDKNLRSSDAIFLNYWWNKSMVDKSVNHAKKIGRSAYDIYTGADMWPQRNAQTAFVVTDWYNWLFSDGRAKTSIAIFAPNFNYNFGGDDKSEAFSLFQKDSTDYARYYATEQRIFVGDDLNLAFLDKQGWPGIASRLSASTPHLSLPFTTSFNTGHGLHLFDNGHKTATPWSDMAAQTALPTWQFAIFGASSNSQFHVSYHFDDAFQGGSSLKIKGEDSRVRVPLFATRFAITKDSELQVTTKNSLSGMAIYLIDANKKRWTFSLSSSKDWQSSTFPLSALAGEQVLELGLITEKGDVAVDGLLGKLMVTQ
ncbi:glycoside hydrolase [Alteromonas macleodii]|uniref:endo-beta-N-acetylglucosaminidase n=1 Tax=Alteromonas macleodii TaxID=28108 RepID=UPI00057D0871|nr:endo-beta-N-acetylglucosaminidase [Alteromonas macleodii]KHT61098.1 glycoside hydrolase [Alteromonas macleodii]